MKPLGDGSKCVSNNGKESEVENNISNSELILSKKDGEQHGKGFQETGSKQDEYSNLMQISRHLAHQLNNLLTTILANTQLVSLMVEDEELKRYLIAVENATREAGAAVREFQGSLRALFKISSK